MEAYLSFTRFRNGLSDDVMKEAAASAAWTAACDLRFTPPPLPLELSVEDMDTLGAIVYCNCLWCMVMYCKRFYFLFAHKMCYVVSV